MALGDEDDKKVQNGEPNGGVPQEGNNIQEGNIINEEPNEGNIINEAPGQGGAQGEDLNSSYIDEDEFGYQIDENQYQTRLTEDITDNPIRDALRADRVVQPQPYVNLQANEVPPQEPQPAAGPSIRDLKPKEGSIPTEHLFYDILRRGLGQIAPVFSDVDQAREYHNFLTALEVLAGDGDGLTRNCEFTLSDGDYRVKTSYNSAVNSREEAWNIVHSQGRLNRILNIPVGNRTVGQEFERNTRQMDEQNMRESATAFVTGRDGQPYPYNNAPRPRRNDYSRRNEGLRIYENAADFAARFGNQTAIDELRNLSMQQVREQMQAMENQVRTANGGQFSEELLSPQNRQRYQYLSDIAYYYQIVKSEGGIRGNEAEHEQRSLYEIDRDMSDYWRGKIYMNHVGDARFERSLRTMNDHMYKAAADPTADEISTLAQQIPAAQQEALIRQNGAHAKLLSLNYLYNVFDREMDLKAIGVGPNSTMMEFFHNVAAQNEQFTRVLQKHAYDPMFRRGINSMNELANLADDRNLSLQRFVRESSRDADRLINEQIMKDTLAPVSADQIKNLNAEMKLEGDTEKITEAVEQNMKQQEVMAKMLFMSQLSGVTIKNVVGDEDEIHRYEGNTADIFAHGERIEFHLPKGSRRDKEKIAGSVLGKNRAQGENGLYTKYKLSRRYLHTNSYTAENIIDLSGGEHRGLNYGGINYKMKMAVGGLGRTGADGKAVLADGKNGCGKIRVSYGREEDDGLAILFGIDPSGKRSDANSRTAFMSDQTKHGMELGGRVVDLHRIPAESFANLMDRFGKYYRDLQKAAISDAGKARELEEVNRQLSGKSMKKDQLVTFMKDKLGIVRGTGERIVDAVNAPRDTVQTEAMNVEIPPAYDPAAELSNEEREKLRQEERLKLDNAIRSKFYEEELKSTGAVPRDGQEDAADPEELQQSDTTQRLGSVLVSGAGRLHHLSDKERDKQICTMIGATVQAKGKVDSLVDLSKIDWKKVAKVPTVEYLLKYDRANFINKARTGNPMKLMEESIKLNEMLKGDRNNANEAQTKLRALYNEMNVPNLKNRTKEYQRMVKTIGQAALKPELSSEDRMSVINAVNNYASEKRYVPKTDNGKISLNNAFKALDAVLPPGYNPKHKFKDPYQERLDDLHEEMQRDGLQDAQPQAHQNNAPQQGVPQA